MTGSVFIRLFGSLVVVLAVSCQKATSPTSPTPTPTPTPTPSPSSPPLVFSPVTLPSGVEGRPYQASFCDPATVDSGDQCPPFGTTGRNPTGGRPPYRFELGSGGGFPPLGLSLSLNGRLTGTPSPGTGAPGGRTYTFTICAVDMAGTFVCNPRSIIILSEQAASLTGVWVGQETQTDSACAYSGTTRMTLTHTGTVLSGTSSVNQTLNRDTTGGSCLPTRVYTMPVSGTVNGAALTFTVAPYDFTGTVDGNRLSATGSAQAVGLTVRVMLELTRQ